MKTNLKIYLAACSVMAALGSCSQEAVEEIGTSGQDKEYRTVTLQAALGNDSRIAFQEGETAVDLLWEENDAFSVLVGTAVQTPATFTLTEGKDTPYGKFSGNVACNDGDKLYAVWPLMTNAMSDENQYYWSLAGQKGVLDDQYTFMVGQGQYKEGQNVRMSFKYSTAALRMNIGLPSGVDKITKVKVMCDVYAGANVSIDSGDLFFDGSTRGGITIENEFDVLNGSVEVVAYFFALDHSRLENAMVVVTDSEGEEYVGYLANGNIRPGKLYDVSINVLPMVDFENEDVADGTEEKPYEIATAEQFYSWMLRAQMDKVNAQDRNYRFCHYKLTNDIVLNNEIIWRPFYMYQGGLDGQGHTLSGNILMHVLFHTGLFSRIEGSVVKNLTLNLNVTFDSPNSHTEWFGLLTADSENSQIVNCVNHSDVIAPFWRIGGLVGRMGYGSSMLACGNTGDLTSSFECRAMGGLVAHMESSNLAVEGCYNTGNMKTAGVYLEDGLHIGGIVGWSTGGNQGSVKNCWSHATMTINNPNAVTVFKGGIVGEMETGFVSNCYWYKEQEVAVGYIGESVVVGKECVTFSEALPTAEQFAVMNASLSSTGWAFITEDGTVGKSSGVTAPSIPKEEW